MKRKELKAWGGFSDGKLHLAVMREQYGDDDYVFAVYKTRRVARAYYQDVRRIRIIEETP